MNSHDTPPLCHPGSPEKPPRAGAGKVAAGGWQTVWMAAVAISVFVSVLQLFWPEKKNTPAPSVAESTLAEDPPAAPPPFPAQASKEAPFTNSLGMKFVPVPGTGTGTGTGAAAPVLFCMHETRNMDYAAFYAEARGDVAEDWRSPTNEAGDPFVRGKNGEKANVTTHPVVLVSWNEATAFCKWLSKKERRIYRLPTDREWSVAAGIPEEPIGEPEKLDSVIKDKYPWGNSLDVKTIQGNLADQSAKDLQSDFHPIEGYTDGFPTTAPVMSFPPNTHGIHDLAGNVSEFCQDRDVPGGSYRIFRGSNWASYTPKDMLSSWRNSGKPGAFRGNGWLGFRIVLAANPPPAE